MSEQEKLGFDEKVNDSRDIALLEWNKDNSVLDVKQTEKDMKFPTQEDEEELEDVVISLRVTSPAEKVLLMPGGDDYKPRQATFAVEVENLKNDTGDDLLPMTAVQKKEICGAVEETYSPIVEENKKDRLKVTFATGSCPADEQSIPEGNTDLHSVLIKGEGDADQPDDSQEGIHEASGSSLNAEPLISVEPPNAAGVQVTEATRASAGRRRWRNYGCFISCTHLLRGVTIFTALFIILGLLLDIVYMF